MNDKHILWYFVIGVLAIIARIFVTMEKLVLYGILRTVSTGAFVGVVVGLGLLGDITMEPWQKYAALGIAVALSEDLMLALISFGKNIKTDPAGFIAALLRKSDK